MKREDEEKTSFTTPFGTYYFVRMPEGLKNAGQSFSRMSSKVLGPQLRKNVLAYVDGIVVTSAERKKTCGRSGRNLREPSEGKPKFES